MSDDKKGGWSKDQFETSHPEKNDEKTDAKVKTNEEGHVSDMIYGTESDQGGGKHGHVWGLDAPNTEEGDEQIGGRDEQKP